MSPAGSRSVTWTPVALSGPLLVAVTVKATLVPKLGVALSTAFVIAMSALGGIGTQGTVGGVIVLAINVTAAVWAIARPVTMLAPLFIVMLASAMRLPWNCVPVPSVAELPTCQYTAHA